MSISKNDKFMILNSKNQPTKKIESFQGLRAIAFLAVFLSHTGLGLDVLGSWGVSIFFYLSGFLMIVNYYDRPIISENNFSFVWQRIKKLYPLHIIMMLLGAIYAFISGSSICKIIMNMILHTLLIQTWFPSPRFYRTLNSITWYLSVSVFLYFCFPCILRIMKKVTKIQTIKRTIIGFIALQIIVAFIARLFGNENSNAIFSMYWITYLCPLSRLIDFIIGCCMGYLYLKNNVTKMQKKYFIVFKIVILSTLCFIFFMYNSKIFILNKEYIRYTLIFTPVSMMILWFTANGGVYSRILNARTLVRIGNLSPYTYLIHYIVIEYCSAIANQFTTDYSKGLIACISLILTFIAAQIWIKMNNFIFEYKGCNITGARRENR